MRAKWLVALAVAAVLLLGGVAAKAMGGKALGKCCGYCQLLSKAE